MANTGTSVPVLFRNGIEIDGGSKRRILGQHFAHPTEESDLFNHALESFIEDGEFEWVDDNNVFLLKRVAIDD